jgi:hypothetical protein
MNNIGMMLLNKENPPAKKEILGRHPTISINVFPFGISRHVLLILQGKNLCINREPNPVIFRV